MAEDAKRRMAAGGPHSEGHITDERIEQGIGAAPKASPLSSPIPGQTASQVRLQRPDHSGQQIIGQSSGQFEQLESASKRLMIAVPAALTFIFVLLYFNFQAATPALLIFLNIPLAATGGLVALLVRGMPFSISAGVGFIALFGIVVLNGIVLLTSIRDLRRKEIPLESAIEHGAHTRLRLVLMTALLARLGFIPMALSHGPGADASSIEVSSAS